MSSEIKYIVGELNKAPYNKNYNIISFDSLTPEQLLQILNDVFTQIDQRNTVDIREEDPNQMVVRMLGMLQVLKYKPPDDIKPNFRAGLVAGQKFIIQPILFWLLSKMEDLKKRAYLAKYLVKIDVPNEIIADNEIAELYNKVDDLIDQFKVVHKECENMKISGYSTAELRRDISMIEEEKDLVTRRIEKMQQKTESIQNNEAMLEAVILLRKEKEKQKEMQQQEVEMRSAIKMAEQRNSRLEKQLKDLRKAGVGMSPEGLLKRLEEEVNVNNYIVMEKMPKELKSKEAAVSILQKIATEPSMGQDEIEAINREITNITNEINGLTMEKVASTEDEDLEGKLGKLSFFRQNAAIISRKKEQTAEKSSDLKNEVINLQDEIKDKNDELKEYSGEEVLKGEEFKIYINQLRSKSSAYKLKKAELSELRSEHGVLSRTEEILKSQHANIEDQLSGIESKAGISGIRDAQVDLEEVSNMKSEIDQKKGATLEDMSQLVRDLNAKIADKKNNLAPLLKEVRPLREKLQNLTVDYNDRKSSFDSVAVGLESNILKLEIEIKALDDEVIKMETKYHLELAEKDILSHKLEKVGEEIRLYLSKDPQDSKKTMREQIMNFITEQEKQSWILRDDQKNMKEHVQKSAKQLTMWNDLIRLMEAKIQHLDLIKSGEVIRNKNSESLVL